MGPPQPTFFLVGSSKAGTSALVRILRQHPGVFISEPNEPNHFATDLATATSGAFRPITRADYLDLFSGARPGQVCGEASGAYLASRDAAANIARFDPTAKVLAILREPVSFLRSYHQQLRRNPRSEGERVRTLERAMALDPVRRRGERLPRGCEVPDLLLYGPRIRYTEQLERFEAHFPESQRLWLVYDDLRADDVGTARRVLDFLGLDADVDLRAEDVNVGGRIRSRSLGHAVHSVSTGGGGVASRQVGRLLKLALPTTVRRRWLRTVNHRVVLGPGRRLDPAFEARLRASVRPEVERLSRHLDRDLVALWGYGDG